MKSSAHVATKLAALERIDSRWAWHHCALLRLRQSLLHAAADHAAAKAVDVANCPPDHECHSNHEAVLAELIAPAERLPEVDAALARIRAHTYGLSETTGEPISAARLRAMPWTREAIPASERHPTKTPS
jgi:RNA polymerase-binding transcription factor DksA